MLFVTLMLVFIFVTLLCYYAVPLILQKTNAFNKKQAQGLVGRVDRYLQDDDIKKTYRLILFGPIILGAVGFIIFPGSTHVIGLVVGVVLGFIFPRMYVNNLIAQRKVRFNDQLMDALMIMSSSFRGGLSLIQAFEAVADEMPDPCRAEFGIVLGENKMGVALDESLGRLYTRTASPAMQQMVTAILLARETGGNLPVIFSRIVGSMRERKKIEQNLQMLTVQGKIQAAVMTGLPIFFVFGVSASNPHFFDGMLHSPDGQKLLMICAVLWVLGALSIWKISSFKEI